MNAPRVAVVAGGMLLVGLIVSETSNAQQFKSPSRGSVSMASSEATADASRGAAAGSETLQPVPAPRPKSTPSSPPLVESRPALNDVSVENPGFPLYDPYAASCPPGCPRKPLCRSFGIYGEYLFLRPGNADVTYAVEQTGCDPLSASPTGAVGIVSPDFASGFRAGLWYSWNPDAQAVLSYTWYENTTSSNLTASPGTVLASQVTHPSQASCGDNSLSASADYGIRFQLLDLDYHRLVYRECGGEVFLLGGFRFGQLEQEFTAQQLTGVAVGLATVNTDIQFDGFGFRLGVGGEQVNARTGLLVYGRGIANFLGGETTARYVQTNQFGGAVPIAVNRTDYRLMSLLEAELGIGWLSNSGRWRLTAGYQANAWFNMLTTGAFIRGVRDGMTDSLGDTLTFDGLVARVEYCR